VPGSTRAGPDWHRSLDSYVALIAVSLTLAVGPGPPCGYVSSTLTLVATFVAQGVAAWWRIRRGPWLPSVETVGRWCGQLVRLDACRLPFGRHS
jgi:hypothetical protein